jgi:predicted ATPase/DNA-binding SARP family transcriptional activator
LTARLEIRLFGAPYFTFDGAPWHFAAPPRALALLGALIGSGDQGLARERAAAALWPEDGELPGRANLRRHLHRLTRALPVIEGVEWIESTKAALRWNPSAPAWIDVREFERALESGTQTELLTAYRGEYLEAHFEDWVVAERERLRGRYAAVLASRIAEAQAAKDHATAIVHAERLLSLDEWREDAVRGLMTARHGTGERAAALSLYDRFARRLRSEFDAEPMPETRALRDAIRANDALATESADGADDWMPAHELLAPLSFAGRSFQIERLRAVWGRAARGNGSTVFVGGEAGIGKSRLARELAAIVTAEGGRVLTGGTSTPEATPYQAVLVALRAGLSWFARPELGTTWIAALAGVLPEMHGLLHDGAPIETIDPEPAQRRLFEAIARAIEEIGQSKPLLIVLEDLQCAGNASLDLLRSLARRMSSARVLLLATHRTGESDEHAALKNLIRDLQKEHRAMSFSLAPLADADFADIVSRTEALRGVPVDFLPRVIAMSGGNPLFAAQVLYGYVEGVTLSASDSRTIGEAISTRLERLDLNVRAVALVAAATGETFRTNFLAEVGGWSENAVLNAVSALVERRMVREAGAASFEYAFTHSLIRQTLYDSIPEAERATRHRRIAAVMSRVEDANDAALARHWSIAGDAPRARAALERAATGALQIYANAEAEAHARAALDLAPDDAERLRLLALMMQAIALLPTDEAYRSDIQAYAGLAETLGDFDALSDALGRRQILQQRLGDREGQRATIAEMTRVAELATGQKARVHAVLALGNLEHVLGRLVEADRELRSALDLALETNDRGTIAEARNQVMVNAILLGNLDAVDELLAEQRTLLSDASAYERCAMISTAAWLAHFREDYDDLMVQSREMLALAELTGDMRREARAHVWLAFGEHLHLNSGHARAHYAHARRLCEQMGHLGELTTVVLNIGALDVEAGHLRRPFEHLDTALELARRIGARTLEGHILSVSSRAFSQLGEPEKALERARAAYDLALDTREKSLMAIACVNLGAAEIGSGSVADGIAHVIEGCTARRELGASESLVDDLAILLEGLTLAERSDEAAAIATEVATLVATRRVVPTRVCLALAKHAKARGDRAGVFKWSQRGKSSLAEYLSRLEPDDRDAFSALPWNREVADWS